MRCQVRDVVCIPEMSREGGYGINTELATVPNWRRISPTTPGSVQCAICRTDHLRRGLLPFDAPTGPTGRTRIALRKTFTYDVAIGSGQAYGYRSGYIRSEMAPAGVLLPGHFCWGNQALANPSRPVNACSSYPRRCRTTCQAPLHQRRRTAPPNHSPWPRSTN